ncbi:MAG: PEP-CTERM sorting domain-containing protein, partial [Planctomycetota bacterium]
VNSGRLTGDGTVDGSVTNAGTLAPGTGVGFLSVTGDYQQTAGGAMAVEILDATGAGSGHDFLDVAGQASLDGDLQLDPGSFRPSHGTAFDLLTGAGLSGIFARIEGVSVDTDLSMAVTYTDDSVRAIAALPADADLDGDVDIVELGGDGISDFNILISNVGTGRTWVEGDFDGDGDVDIVESGGTSDFNTLISNVGASPDLGDDNAAGTGDVELVYDVTTGEVYLENAGGFEFVAFGSDGNVLPDGEDADGLNGAMSAFKDSDAVLYSGVAGNTTEDSVGLMLVTDLEAAEIGVFGQNSGEDAVDGVVTVIPEPATMSLLALGGVAALIRRKRR